MSENTITDAEIEAVVRDVLIKHCAVTKEVKSESRLAEDLGLDSVGLLTLAVEVENHFRTVLGEEPENPPRLVSDVVRLVRERLAEQGAGGSLVDGGGT